METEKLEALLKAATPGPWGTKGVKDVFWAVDTDGDNSSINIGPKKKLPVCIAVVNSSWGKDDILDANAALIAAAPDLAAEVLLARRKIEQLVAANQALVTREAKAREVVQNLMGYVDTPISRRRLSIVTDQPEWLTNARAFLAVTPAPPLADDVAGVVDRLRQAASKRDGFDAVFLANSAADLIERLAREKAEAERRVKWVEAEINSCMDANFRQAMCINHTASALGPEISATIDGLPKAARHVRTRAEKAEAERDTAIAALEAAAIRARRQA